MHGKVAAISVTIKMTLGASIVAPLVLLYSRLGYAETKHKASSEMGLRFSVVLVALQNLYIKYITCS